MRRFFAAFFAAAMVLVATNAADDHKTFNVGKLSFNRPEKWTWVEITPGMRAAQLELKGEQGKKAEVIFFNFPPGQGGGAQANIDRWLGMFQEGKDKINARTDKVSKDKGTITFVQAEGTYMSGMPGGAKTPQPGTMLQGAIIEGADSNIFIRMTGPKNSFRVRRPISAGWLSHL